MIEADKLERVCRTTDLLKLGSTIPTYVTIDRSEGLELRGGKLVSFWVKDGERIYDQPVSDHRIASIIKAFADPAKEEVKEEKAVVPLKETDKKHNELVIGNVSALAGQYGIPVELANLFFMKFDNQLYIKNPGLLWIASKKGYGHMEVTDKFNEETKEWEAEYKIYPVLTKEIIEAIAKLDPGIQEKAMIEATRPCNGTGRAGDKNIKMKPMLAFARELAQTRAQNRALRAFTGYGGTSAEELGEVNV